MTKFETDEEIEAELKRTDLAPEDEQYPDSFPELSNISAAFFYQFVARPKTRLPPEFAYIPVDSTKRNQEDQLFRELLISQWNSFWEAGHLRPKIVPELLAKRKEFPKELSWLKKTRNVNLYLIPDGRQSRFDAFSPLYHLLPIRLLDRFTLPRLRRGLWPPSFHQHTLDYHITPDFDERVSTAFASHVWPLLNSGSKIEAFSKHDSIVLLSHNLNYWLPWMYQIVEERLGSFSRVEIETQAQGEMLQRARKDVRADMTVDRPLRGGTLWRGEEEAWEATREMVNAADRYGDLRAIIDAVKSHRVVDEFSPLWSYAKEDFERKLYQKRAKVRVSFVELEHAEPVHAPTSEIHENLLWEDFFALLDIKERRIVVCLKNGVSRATEISKKLGYANHSPVSKALKRIRLKAKKLLEE